MRSACLAVMCLCLCAALSACGGRGGPHGSGSEARSAGATTDDCDGLLDACPERQGTAICLPPSGSRGDRQSGVCRVTCSLDVGS